MQRAKTVGPSLSVCGKYWEMVRLVMVLFSNYGIWSTIVRHGNADALNWSVYKYNFFCLCYQIPHWLQTSQCGLSQCAATLNNKLLSLAQTMYATWVRYQSGCSYIWNAEISDPISKIIVRLRNNFIRKLLSFLYLLENNTPLLFCHFTEHQRCLMLYACAPLFECTILYR